MNILHLLCISGTIFVTVQSFCCPQPENAGKCGCCPDACCCMCEDIPLTPPPCSYVGLDLLFVVDSSASIRTDGWNTAMNFIANFVAKFNDIGTATRVAFILYNTQNAEVRWNLAAPETHNLTILQQSFRNTPFDASFTNTPAALRLAYTSVFGGAMGDRPDVDYPDVAIFLSDGKTNIEKGQVAFEAANLRAETSLVYAIGLKASSNYTELNEIADGANNESVYFINDLTDFNDQVNLVDDIEMRVTEQLCSQLQQGAPTSMERCKCCCPPLPSAGYTCGGPCDPSNTGTAGRKR